MTPASIIAIKLAHTTADDENEPELLDVVTLVAIPGTDAFDALLTFPTPHSGPIKLHYQIGV